MLLSISLLALYVGIASLLFTTMGIWIEVAVPLIIIPVIILGYIIIGICQGAFSRLYHAMKQKRRPLLKFIPAVVAVVFIVSLALLMTLRGSEKLATSLLTTISALVTATMGIATAILAYKIQKEKKPEAAEDNPKDEN